MELVCNGKVILARLEVLGRASNTWFKVDTGSAITVIDAATVSSLFNLNLDSVKRFVHANNGLTFNGVGGGVIKVAPMFIRNSCIGNGYGSGIELGTFYTFVTDKDLLQNLIGMDFIAACAANMRYGFMSINAFNREVYEDNFKFNCQGITVQEISALFSAGRSVASLLDDAEGNK